MKRILSGLLASLVVVALSIGSSLPVEAQSLPPGFKRIENLVPNTAAGELSHRQEFHGDVLFRETIDYSDGRKMTREFHPNGHLKGEVVLSTDGTAEIKLFLPDGEGILRTSRIQKDRVEQSEYRPDGKTLWTRSVHTQSSGRTVDYFDESGRLRVNRVFQKDGIMRVTVFDGNGDEAYVQIWRAGTSGYVLDSVEETLSSGEKRRVVISGGQVEQCDYLSTDGSVERSEHAGQLTHPVDPLRLREYAPGDDPSIPIMKEPDNRLRR